MIYMYVYTQLHICLVDIVATIVLWGEIVVFVVEMNGDSSEGKGLEQTPVGSTKQFQVFVGWFVHVLMAKGFVE